MKHASLVLEVLDHLATCGTSLALHAFFKPYGTTLSQAIRESERIARSCPHDFSTYSRRTVSVTLSRLKNRGFVSGSGSRKKMLWRITSGGRKHFVATRKSDNRGLPSLDGKQRFVVFDIPEEYRKERRWLRMRLLSCDYTPFQKSVWIGMRPLPDELLGELKERQIMSYVHIVGLEEVFKRVKGG